MYTIRNLHNFLQYMTQSYRDETISLIDDLGLESKIIEYDPVGFEHINNDYFCGFEVTRLEDERRWTDPNYWYWSAHKTQLSLFDDEMY
jgi:hypothetical protein